MSCNIFSQFCNWVQDSFDRQHQIDQVKQMTDRELQDLGVSRYDLIKSISCKHKI